MMDGEEFLLKAHLLSRGFDADRLRVVLAPGVATFYLWGLTVSYVDTSTTNRTLKRTVKILKTRGTLPEQQDRVYGGRSICRSAVSCLLPKAYLKLLL